MTFIFKIGPVETLKDGSASSYFSFSETAGLQCVIESGDARGLRKLLTKIGRDQAVCEPALHDAAAEFGVDSGPLPKSLLLTKAGLSLSLSQGPSLFKVKNPFLFEELVTATAAFFSAEPWTQYDSDQPLEIRVTGTTQKSFEASVMGAHGEEYGLALYFQPGSIEQVIRFVDRGEPEAAAMLECLSLVTRQEASFLEEAIEAATGVAIAPAIIRMKRGDAVSPTDDEVACLIAALNAVTDLSVRGVEGRGDSKAGSRIHAIASLAGENRASPAPHAASNRQLGRNDPCPCGSGKKLKKCHPAWPEGSAPQPKASPPQRTPSKWHECDGRVVSLLLEFGKRRFGKDQIADSAKMLFGQREAQPLLLMPWVAFERPFEGKSLASHFLESPEGALDDDARSWLQAQLKSRLSVWEVLQPNPGNGLELVDLLGSAKCFVHEVRASETLGPREAILARVVEIDGVCVLSGIHGQPLPPLEADGVVQQVKALGEGGSNRYDPLKLVRLWDERVSAMALQAATASKVTNTDGELIVWVEDTFEIAEESLDAVVGCLSSLEYASIDKSSHQRAALTFTKPGNAMHPEWKSTVVGSAQVTPRRLRLKCNSVARADGLKSRVERALGPVVRFKSRKESPEPDMRGHERLAVDAQPVSLVDNAVPSLLRQSYLSWLDKPLSTLEGKSPRQAMQTAWGRERVHVHLKELEYFQGRRPQNEDLENQFDVRLLRRELGLTELGELNPNHQVDIALGAGRKISETLLDFAQPLLSEPPTSSKRDMEAKLRFSAVIWNSVVEEDSQPGAMLIPKLRESMRESGLPTKFFDLLVVRKREKFHEDRRQIGNIFVTQENGRWGVKVEARAAEELRRQASEAGILPTAVRNEGPTQRP